MLKEETQGFLRRVHPLDLLPEEDLEELVGEVTLEYFPRGVKILTQGGAPAEHLYLVKKGGVRVYMAADGEGEIAIDARSEEDYFGLISLISGDPPRATIAALEDTICYLIPKEKLLAVLSRHPAVNESLMKSYLIHFIDRTYAETKSKYADSFSHPTLLSTRVGEILRKEPVSATSGTSIQDAARLMAEHKVSSVLVTGEGGKPVGIVTDRDLREKVVATGRDLSRPLQEIMSAPLVGVDAGAHCFEALLRMMRHGIHHIAVLGEGRLRGVVTHHDFMILQGASPAVLAKEVATSRTIGALEGTGARLFKTVSTLVREGAKAHDTCDTITAIVESYLQRFLDLREEEHGPPPLPYALFLLGDGGRRELFLDLRVELGAAYEESADAEVTAAARTYFGELREVLGAQAIAARLAAENVRSFAEWRAAAAWPGETFDLRPLRGDAEAVEALHHDLVERAAADPRLRADLVVRTVANRPPIGFFRRFVVDTAGEHKNELDLHAKGVRPLAEVVRVFALDRGIAARSTWRRLREMCPSPSLPLCEEIEQAFDYVGALLLHHQLAQVDDGEEPTSFLSLEELAPREKKTLKEAFQLIAQLYETLPEPSPGAGS